jgi:hypothetical protein
MAHGNGQKNIRHNSSDRRYPFEQTIIDNRPVRVRRIRCAEVGCGKVGELLDQTNGGLPSGIVEIRFGRKGWEVGANEKHDFCPECVAKRQAERRQRRIKPIAAPQETNVVQLTPQEDTAMNTVVSVDAVLPELSRADRRIIFAKLEEVYESEDAGYKMPWTDQAVAKDLGNHIPVGWVAQVREENFGPIKDNAEIRGLFQRVETSTVEARGFLDEVKAVRKDAATLVERVNDLAKRATEVGKSLEGILAIADRIERSVR